MFPFETCQRWVYVLKLEEGKYYVGQTDDLEKRMKRHGTKHGAAWTHIYKPVEIIRKIDLGVCTEETALKRENEITLEFMKAYGWENVRGGQFTNPNELKIYNQFIAHEAESNLPFRYSKPQQVDERHKLKIFKGMNRSKDKLDLFKNFDAKSRATIHSSIQGTFGGRTSNMTIEQIEAIDIKDICDRWFNKNSTIYASLSYEDALQQFTKLKRDKIYRKPSL